MNILITPILLKRNNAINELLSHDHIMVYKDKSKWVKRYTTMYHLLAHEPPVVVYRCLLYSEIGYLQGSKIALLNEFDFKIFDVVSLADDFIAKQNTLVRLLNLPYRTTIRGLMLFLNGYSSP